MEIEKKIELLADLFEVETSEIIPEKKLTDYGMWDSMMKLSLIVLVDDEFGKKLTGEQIRTFVTIQDVLNFME